MQVKTKFKQTEIGLLPEDWLTAPLRMLIEPARKIMYGIVVAGPYVRDGIFLIRAQDYSNYWALEGDVYRVALAVDNAYARSRVLTGDILLTIVGSVGNLAKVPAYFNGANITRQSARLAFVSSIANQDFYLNYLGSEYGKKEIANYTKSGVQPSLNLADVEKFIVPVPHLPEQRAIATALSDVDALINSLDRLISKKRDIKQAAKQQLLTGKTRLPGFKKKDGFKQTEIGLIPEDWRISTVGKEFDIQLGKMLDVEKNVGVPKPYIGNKAVQWGAISIEDLSTMAMSRSDLERFRLRRGDLLVCEGGEVGRAAIWTAPIDECYYQKALHRLRPVAGFSSALMVYMLKYWKEHGFLNNFVSQTSIAHLTREKFLEIPMPVPPVQEQHAIAIALSDMDAELSTLKQRRDKTLLLKQGMMQELLTGRTRLV